MIQFLGQPYKEKNSASKQNVGISV